MTTCTRNSTQETPSVALIGVGAMGAALGGELVRHGITVTTDVSQRSPTSQARAQAAGLTAASASALLDADYILSILPPSLALDTARQTAAAWQADARRPKACAPIYVDCNALSPDTTLQVGRIVQDAGMGYVDASIIGLPPRPGRPAPRLYACGPWAEPFAALSAYGLGIRVLPAALGAASALKMCYASITKGLIAVASSAIMAAERAGIADPLASELAGSQAALLRSLKFSIPDMLPKAYRWVGEMEEIAAFLGQDRPESDIYRHISALYAAIANAQPGYEATVFEAFLNA